MFRAVSTSIFLLLISTVSAAENGPPADEVFARGVSAFKSGDYRQAADYFRQAEQSGMDTPALHYNLGAAYYRLKQFDRARKEFQRLTAVNDTAALAHYNLGLIALEIQDGRTADRHFSFVLRNSNEERLRRLAEIGLGKASRLGRSRIWSGYASLSGGYTDNVALNVDDEIQVGKTADEFWEFTGSLTGRITGTKDNGLQIRSTGYYLDYLTEDEFDIGSFRIGPELTHRVGQWDTTLGGYVNWAVIDKNLFERIFTAGIEASRQVSADLKWRLEYSLDRIDAEDPYEELTGNRHRLGTGLRAFIFGAYTGVDYELEINNRDDADYPTRHDVKLLVYHDLTRLWSADATGSYRFSTYPHTDRSDSRLWLTVRISRKIPWSLRVFGKYDYLRNNSDLPEEEYTTNIFSVGVEHSF